MKFLDIPIKYIIFAFLPTVLFVVGFEMISYVLIRYVDGYDWYKKANGHGQIYFLSSEQSEYSYNRILSGYRVAKNRPGHKFVRTIKTNPDQPDVVIDNNGFIADVPVKRNGQSIRYVCL